MPEPNAQQQGAKPAPAQPNSNPNTQREAAARRDKFFLAVAAAVMMRQNGRTPTALARECVAFTDAFLAALDTPTGA